MEKRRFVEDPKQKLCDFIKGDNLERIIPFQVGSTSEDKIVQIRLSKETYNSLKQETINTLKKYANEPVDNRNVYGDDSEGKRLYEEEYFWKRCQEYIFSYSLEGYWITYSGEWGYEGMDEGKTIEFVKNDQFPLLITRNFGCGKRFKET